MACKAVSDAVDARVAAHFSRCPVFSRNLSIDEATPVDGSPYLIVQYPLGNESIIAIGDPGNRLFREEGAFRFILHVQRGQGVSQGLQWIDELRALFRAVDFSGVVTLSPSAPVEDDANDNGNYYLISTAVPYQFDLAA